MAVTASARDWHVDADHGRDGQDGTADAALLKIQEAVDRATPGDVIRIGPPGATFREQIDLVNVRGLTLEGPGVTVSGADPLDSQAWEQVADGLSRIRLPNTPLNRYLLVVDGRVEVMNQKPNDNKVKSFPAPEELVQGEFAFELDEDGKQGWLYVAGDVSELEFGRRLQGIRVGGKTRDIVVRDLRLVHTLNDGIGVAGQARGLRFERVVSAGHYDESASLHQTAEAAFEDCRFADSYSAIAHVHASRTLMIRCTLSGSRGPVVVLNGGDHQLIDCVIESGHRVPLRVSAWPGNPKVPAHPAAVLLRNTKITADVSTDARMQIKPEVAIALEGLELQNVAIPDWLAE
ncbi:MAG: hypothetical protein AAF710_00375 [Planctomycetota bacterium]